MAKIIVSLRALWKDERGEAVIYGMVATITGAILIGLVALASNVDTSFSSVSALLGSVASGL